MGIMRHRFSISRWAALHTNDRILRYSHLDDSLTQIQAATKFKEALSIYKKNSNEPVPIIEPAQIEERDISLQFPRVDLALRVSQLALRAIYLAEIESWCDHGRRRRSDHEAS